MTTDARGDTLRRALHRDGLPGTQVIRVSTGHRQHRARYGQMPGEVSAPHYHDRIVHIVSFKLSRVVTRSGIGIN
jgi:hypothetical protein